MSENIKNNNSVIAAGIDIGSNSIRMLIGKVVSDKITEMIVSEKYTTRLASHIKKTGRLSEQSFLASIEVLKKFKETIDQYNVKKIKAFATSAVREAENGKDFIKSAKDIGINIDILSGIEEANMVFTGVKTGMDISSAPLIFDIGGGSTEFIAAKNQKVEYAESHKIGVVKLVDQFDMGDNALKNIPLCREFVKDYFKNLKLPDYYEQMIATAGTATTIAAIDMEMSIYDWKKINGYKIHKSTIESLLYKIASTSYKERINITGMEKGREDLVIPGIIIILEIMSKSNFNDLTISDFGLREGALVAAANS